MFTAQLSFVIWVQARGILRHIGLPNTVASFRTWRGFRAPIAQPPWPDKNAGLSWMDWRQPWIAPAAKLVPAAAERVSDALVSSVVQQSPETPGAAKLPRPRPVQYSPAQSTHVSQILWAEAWDEARSPPAPDVSEVVEMIRKHKASRFSRPSAEPTPSARKGIRQRINQTQD